MRCLRPQTQVAAGDVVFWDNRCTMHFAQTFDDKTFTRHMHRTTVQGDRPLMPLFGERHRY